MNVKTIYVETKKLLNIIGYENINEIKGKKDMVNNMVGLSNMETRLDSCAFADNRQ